MENLNQNYRIGAKVSFSEVKMGDILKSSANLIYEIGFASDIEIVLNYGAARIPMKEPEFSLWGFRKVIFN